MKYLQNRFDHSRHTTDCDLRTCLYKQCRIYVKESFLDRIKHVSYLRLQNNLFNIPLCLIRNGWL